MNKRILFCGLGGGLDIINASVLYFIAKSKGIEVMLGSTRPSSQTYMYEHKSIDNCLSLVTKDTIFDFKGRYIEPRVSKILGEDVVFFSRRYNGKYSKTFLRNAVIAAKKELDLSHIFFIDGGGDSLILRSKDSGRSNYNVFKGGDAELLAAIRGISDVYMAVMSPGLDIKYHAFKENKKIIKNHEGYFGRVNLLKKKHYGYKLGHIIPLMNISLDPYFKFAEKVLVLKNEDLNNKKKMPSLTATVTYHALKGNFGLCRTFVSWENIVGPDIEGNPTGEWQIGTIVKPRHSRIYFFDPIVVENLKVQLRGRR